MAFRRWRHLAPCLRPEPIDGVSMRPKESGKVRYAYGVAMALLLGGTAFSLATGQAGRTGRAERARHLRARAAARRADVVRRPRRQASAGGGQYLDQAARAGAGPDRPVRGILPPLRPDHPAGRPGPGQSGSGAGPAAADARNRLARLGLHHLARRLHRHQQPPDPGRDRHRHGRHRHRDHDRPQGIFGADRRP